ncbi:response regulator [uncultured Thiodictyon sp.]|uniref:response regulator n=1 Tax=uncultured Thiodictyon sp. TaxID=1846217 RepID=UPI0025F60F29|nr:response regulator [uncultured Thiodictyon sp.]
MQSKPDLESSISPDLRILSVDDQPKSLEQMCTLLRRLGLKCRSYLDPVTALADALMEPSDVLITGLAMPGIDGRELIQRLRKRSPHTRVIAVTDMLATGAGLDQDGEPATADFLLAKPVQPLALLAALYTSIESTGSARLPGWAG